MDYKRVLDQAHDLLDQHRYDEASAKFQVAAGQNIKDIWKANSLHNAGLMLGLAGKSKTETNKLLDEALAILGGSNPLDETNILIKTRIDRKQREP